MWIYPNLPNFDTINIIYGFMVFGWDWEKGKKRNPALIVDWLDQVLAIIHTIPKYEDRSDKPT